MRNLVLILCSLFIFSGTAHAIKCAKCHREDKAIDKIIQEREIKSKDELFHILRNGKMAKLHKNLSNEEIEESAKLLNLK